MTDRKLMQQMYDLLLSEPRATVVCDRLESMLRERLAQPQQIDLDALDIPHGQLFKPARQGQEPVAWRYWHSNGDGTESEDFYIGRSFPEYKRPLRPPVPLYTTPPRREWVGLTDEEMHECWDSPLTPLGMKHARAIEAALKEKNHE